MNAISNAVHVVFEKHVHPSSFLHFKGNLDMKLREYGVPKNERMELLKDVFENLLELETGLIDADSEQEFEALVESVKDVWEQRESPYNSPPQFHSWFKYCKDGVKDTMLKSKELSGLGNPPEPFYMNDVVSESSDQAPDTVQSKRIARFHSHNADYDYKSETRKLIERAVVGVGEYQWMNTSI